MTKPDSALDRAHALLARFPLVDAHNDLPYVIRRRTGGDVPAFGLERRQQRGDTDIPRLREGRVAAQFFAAFVPTDMANPGTVTLEQIDIAREIAAAHPEAFLPGRRAADVARARRLGRIASFITVESCVGLEGSLAPLRIWHAAGVRLVTLCHNETLDWIDSATDPARHGGMTDFGRAVVAELNRLGIIVDLAHTSHAAQHAILDVAEAPVVFSHGNAFALCDHPRNIKDDILDRLRASGGLAMATFVPTFINQQSYDWVRPLQNGHGKAPPTQDVDAAIAESSRRRGPWPRATLAQLCDHIEYMAARIGHRHLGIGSDFYGGPVPDGLEDVSRFPHLFAELIRRGWGDDALAGLAGGNFLRVFRAVERKARELAATRPVPAHGRQSNVQP
jgi:membrane dipeptidase